MKKRFFSLQKALALSVLLLFTAVMTGCKPDATETPEYVPEDLVKLQDGDPLIGDWISPYCERFIISINNFSTKGLDYEADPSTWMNEDGTFNFVDTYAGNNLYVLKINQTSGIFFMKYTKAQVPNTFHCSDNPNEAPDIGKWYAVYYSDFDSTNLKIKFSGALKTDGKTSCDTLAEAVEEFTVENGYFAANSTCQPYDGE